MIVPMMKYSFVIYHEDYEKFLSELQELGLVDVTVSGWEPTDKERKLVSDIGHYKTAARRLDELRKSEDFTPREPFDSGKESLRQYIHATAEQERLDGEIDRVRKEIEELKPWGEFSLDQIRKLAEKGIRLHFFTAYNKEFNAEWPVWAEKYAVEKISESGGMSYFVVVADPETEAIDIDATEVKLPEGNWREKEHYLDRLKSDREKQEEILERAASGYDDLVAYGRTLEEQLQLSKVKTTADREAEGTLVVLEGYATEDTQEKVDAFLETDDTAYVIKEQPSGQDDPPVLLRNNRFARLFEIIGGFYSLPKYGTVDFTPYFAPFYMIFFGFCLADAGYGTLYVIGALVALAKVPSKYKPMANLVLLCGISTIFFGLLTGNAFGIQLADQPLFGGLSRYMISSDQLFYLAIGVGIVHIIYALVLKVIFTAKLRGLKYSLSTLGWIIVILSGLSAFLLPDLGIESYTVNSIPFWIVTGLGLFMMLFLNSPGKNPFVNFGTGLWNTYNDVSGLLSDVLSYIRLFALGLSGGILALVFNRLAVGMSPDIPVLKYVIFLLILLIGQGLTLFMASLSAFVHPLRLTFVEFYKNAGFEPGGRPFEPLKKNRENENNNV